MSTAACASATCACAPLPEPELPAEPSAWPVAGGVVAALLILFAVLYFTPAGRAWGPVLGATLARPFRALEPAVGGPPPPGRAVELEAVPGAAAPASWSSLRAPAAVPVAAAAPAAPGKREEWF